MILHGLLTILVKHLIGMLDTVPDHQHRTDALVVTDKCLDSLKVKVILSHQVLRHGNRQDKNGKPLS